LKFINSKEEKQTVTAMLYAANAEYGVEKGVCKVSSVNEILNKYGYALNSQNKFSTDVQK
jgi:hypothetical protein